MKYDTSEFERILEYQFVRFIDTTPNSQTPTWALIGAVEEGGAVVEYNPNVDRIKYIVHKNASTNHTSNDKQMDVTYQAYKGDPCFTFVNGARDKTNVRTHLLEVDLWDKDEQSKYSAKMSEATIVVENNNGQEIGFNVYGDGDPDEGKVTIADNTPTFTPTTSL
jgi:hypothetical protein